MTACEAMGCTRDDTRRYMSGHCCPNHTPAATAGRPEPITQDASWVGRSRQTLASARGGTDINKDRPGGYMSRQRAKKIAETRDAVRKQTEESA